MCSIKIPVLHVSSSSEDSGASGEKEGDKAGQEKKKERMKENVGSGASSFQTVTIIDPEDGAGTPNHAVTGYSISTTKPITRGAERVPLRDVDTTPQAKEECDWIPAVFIFGGMDSLGHVHGDSFLFVPS